MMSKRFTIFIALLGVCIAVSQILPSNAPVANAWDGRWTNAVSGQYPLPDKKSSHSDGGMEPSRPQHYVLPPNPRFEEVDPEEISDNQGKDASPYALARLTQSLSAQGKTIAKGYYLVKIGYGPQPQLPSIDNELPHAEKSLPPLSEIFSPSVPVSDAVIPADASETITDKLAFWRRNQPEEPPFNVLILKQQGKIVMTLPIAESSLITPQKGQRLPRAPLAWVEGNTGQPGAQPTLKFYYRQTVYIAHLG